MKDSLRAILAAVFVVGLALLMLIPFFVPGVNMPGWAHLVIIVVVLFGLPCLGLLLFNSGRRMSSFGDGVRTMLAAAFLAILLPTVLIGMKPKGVGMVYGALVGLSLLVLAMHLFNARGMKSDRVTVDDEGIVRTLPDGQTESIRWADLEEVGIITTAGGPGAEDVYWVLRGAQGGCVVSGGADGNKELFARLQELPGFDNAVLIEAMGCTSNAKFVCWRRDQGKPDEGGFKDEAKMTE